VGRRSGLAPREVGMIAVSDLSIQQGRFALEQISFHVPTGKYAVMMGQTGTGKTTLLEAICGLRPIRGGRIELLSRDVTRLKPADRGLAYLPQDLALFQMLTVREHLAFALVVRRWPKAQIDRRVGQLAELLGMPGLSGGESQRVALGRALACEPRVLLLDEPLSALDDVTRNEIYQLLRSVQHQTGVTALHVTHSQAEARALADVLLLLERSAVREAPLTALVG
jgi:ABC-type sugar transport system ATPase subunit